MYILNIILSLTLIIFVSYFLYSRRFSIPCPSWLWWLIERDNPFFKINQSSTIIDHLELKPDMTILDVGCGPGRITIPIAKKISPTGKVVAIDIQANMISKAKEKAKRANLTNIQFIQAAIGEGKLEQENFDRALLVTVLGEIPKANQQAALEEIYNSLKLGGILSITEIILDPHFQSRTKVLEIARAAGFKEKNFFGNRFAFTINLIKPISKNGYIKDL